MKFSKRQIEIIQASKDLIGIKGIQNFTISKLAKKMRFSEPALYRHFKDKTEILRSVLLFHKEMISNGISEIITSDAPALEKIRSIIEFQFSHLKKNPSIIMVVFSETSFQYNNILSNLLTKVIKQRTKKLMKLIEEGQNNNEIKSELDPKQIATIIMGSMRLTVLKWKFNNFKTDLEQDGSELWITIEKLIKQ